jgi:hypothetical protein
MPLLSECLVCSYPVLADAYNMSSRGEMAHLKCPSPPASGNRWPEGVRQLVCLNCSRTFPSESKIQRLCRACR